MQCICSVTRDCVFIDEERKNHIVERHFNSSVNNTQHPRQAFFNEEVFSPGKLFNTVIHELRNGLQPHEKSGSCYIYHLHFPFDAGFFPNQSHGPTVTAIVRVVCRFTVCKYCCCCCPSKVVSIYPWMPKRNWTYVLQGQVLHIPQANVESRTEPRVRVSKTESRTTSKPLILRKRSIKLKTEYHWND